jgi:hypothetical protein
MKTRNCDDCAHHKWPGDSCEKGHMPRFYKPRSPVDTSFGFKRKCGDFKGKEKDDQCNN